MEWSNVKVSTKPIITEEIWPGRGLNPGLPIDTPAIFDFLGLCTTALGGESTY
jgi:hypothetical protein